MQHCPSTSNHPKWPVPPLIPVSECQYLAEIECCGPALKPGPAVVVPSTPALSQPRPVPSKPPLHFLLLFPVALPPFFMRGSIIQLADGELKRVEDLKAEDFIQSAEISSELKIDSKHCRQRDSGQAPNAVRRPTARKKTLVSARETRLERAEEEPPLTLPKPSLSSGG
ncbi:ataxin-1 [Lates japonicus]|uniref:Ataxin-1 n=1 Tax=Lates japonicus TaxID=270547 RepID=A0AAD3RAU9_LATJO|nr:ataxin-1 [Lates japonicus]